MSDSDKQMANSLFLQGMDLYSSATKDKRDLVKWHRENHLILVKAQKCVQEANRLFGGRDPEVLAMLGRLSFDLLNNTEAWQYCQQALAIDPNEFNARYTIFLIAWNKYAEKKRKVVVFGGIIGVALNINKALGDQVEKDSLNQAAKALCAAGVANFNNPSLDWNDKLILADTLMDSGQMMSELKLSSNLIYLTVAKNLRLDDCPDELHNEVYRRISESKDHVRL